MEWQPITDLPSHWRELENTELPPLVTVWNEQANRLKESGAFKTFLTRLCREIAIETGVIERLYTLDRGITRILIEQGINESLIPHGATNRPVNRVVALIQDQEAAVEGLFDFVGGQRNLSTSYIKQLHQLLTQNQRTTEALIPSTGDVIEVALVRGDWKKQPNNPMRRDGNFHEYCPPEQVASEMDRLIDLHRLHQQQQVPPEVEAAWLHHRFTQVHPFQDGNGRVARCLASLVFIQAGWFPLALTRDDRKKYIDASEQADVGDLHPLIDLFAKSQKQAFIRSLGLSEQILSESRRTQVVIDSIAKKFQVESSLTIQRRCEQVEQYAAAVNSLAVEKLNNIADEIKASLQNLLDDFQIFTIESPTDGSKAHYHRYQIVETAKQMGYFANIRPYHRWIQLVINLESSTTLILISFHVLGHEYRGLLAGSACAYHRDDDEDGKRNANDIQALTDSLFQFSYADTEIQVINRFRAWLEEVIVAGLEYWNESL